MSFSAFHLPFVQNIMVGRVQLLLTLFKSNSESFNLTICNMRRISPRHEHAFSAFDESAENRTPKNDFKLNRANVSDSIFSHASIAQFSNFQFGISNTKWSRSITTNSIFQCSAPYFSSISGRIGLFHLWQQQNHGFVVLCRLFRIWLYLFLLFASVVAHRLSSESLLWS